MSEISETSSEVNEYNYSKIYSIRSTSTPYYYIGSTTLDLNLRFNLHKSHYRQYKRGKFNYMTSFEVLCNDNCYIELIEEYYCENKKELHQREGEHIRSHRKLTVCHLVNKKIDGRTPKEYLRDNSEKIKLYQKDYRHTNDVYYKEYMKNWLEHNPNYMKNYRNKVKENLRTVV